MVLHDLGLIFLSKCLKNRVFWTKKKNYDTKRTLKCVLENPAQKIKIYPQTSFEPKYGALYRKNKVSAHGLVLLVQLS